jgi:hypothetical protein
LASSRQPKFGPGEAGRQEERRRTGRVQCWLHPHCDDGRRVMEAWMDGATWWCRERKATGVVVELAEICNRLVRHGSGNGPFRQPVVARMLSSDCAGHAAAGQG